MQKKLYTLLLFCAILSITACKKDTLDKSAEEICAEEFNSLKINELQYLGSHNSYRRHTYQPLYNFVASLASVLPPEYDPKGWDYDHLPLEQQLTEYGMRNFEIDIYHDPVGGRFYERKGLQFIQEPTASNIPDLLQPGFKVMHIPDFDYMTNYYTFKQALTAFKNWSDANPNHLPIFILIETKTETVADVLTNFGFTTALPFTPAALDSIDLEINQVFGENSPQIITPDQIKGSYSTLNEAVKNNNWLTVKQARGKIMFVLNGGSDHNTLYAQGHPSLTNRKMFIFGDPNQPETAFVKRDSPQGNEADIKNLVQQGYIVRSRADSDSDEARNNDYSTFNACINAGSQLISTDFYKPDTALSTYFVAFKKQQLAIVNPYNTTATVISDTACVVKE